MGIKSSPKDVPPDSELVFRWKAGSLSAFEALVRRYQPRLLAFAAPRLGNRQDAEDAVQRSFVKMYQGIDRYREEHSFQTWAFMITRRQIIDLQRSSGSRRRLQEEAASQQAPDDMDTRSPGDTMDQHERSADIWTWVRRHVTEQAFTALWLQVQEDMRDTEIAWTMKLSRTHVRVILHRARKRLVALRMRAERPSSSRSTNTRSPRWPHIQIC